MWEIVSTFMYIQLKIAIMVYVYSQQIGNSHRLILVLLFLGPVKLLLLSRSVKLILGEKYHVGAKYSRSLNL